MRWPTHLPRPQGTGTKLEAPNRRLVVMFDGTWNERENLTNVARMFEAIDDYKPAGYKYTVEEGHSHHMDPLLYKGPEPVQLVKYLKGVGTNVVGHFAGGAVGFGLSGIIKEGYRWLSQNYLEGDEIFVFGFSRGAYSARSLVSLIHRCRGVLNLDMDYGDPCLPGAKDIDECARIYNDPLLTKGQWLNVHRGDPDHPRTSRLLGAAYDLHTNFQDTVEYAEKMNAFGNKYCQHVSIKMLGVWDTVGSVGLRFEKGSYWDRNCPWSSSYYDLIHGQKLPCIVENAYHALAIDEHREPFLPTLWESWMPWDENKKLGNKQVEQVWFIGSHCNVGGGATAINKDGDEDPDDLFQYSYMWMQEKAHALGLRFTWLYTPLEAKRVSRTVPEDSYRLMLKPPFMKEGLYCKLRPPVNRPVVDSTGSLLHGSSLHWSVVERMKQDPEYRPASLPIHPNDVITPDLFTTSDSTKLLTKTCSCTRDTESPKIRKSL
ncbi:hypothetical protein M758_3G235000 [Ceratodon purpureus]|nr:hypothetical protein M758_3G235000 [Ceratodon purpureus]